MIEFVPLIERLASNAACRPEAEAIVQAKRRVSYGQLWSDVRGVAVLLQQHGVRPGDRVAVLWENSPEYVAAYYGALAIGAVAVALNPSARLRELSAWIEHCGATALILDTRHPDTARLVDALPDQMLLVGDDADLSRVLAWPHAATDAAPVVADVSADALAAIIYTSGTTGRPKGVSLTHGNLSANTAAIVEYLELSAADRVLNVLPFFYSYGSSVLHTHLAVGGALVLENSLVYPQRVLETMATERVTGFPGVPSTFAVLLQGAERRILSLPSLRYMTQAGGAMAPRDIRRVCELVPNARLFVMYGQTEATARLSYLPPARLPDKMGSVGIPVRGVDITILGEAGEVAPAETPGEVCVRGVSVMAGYYRDPAATSEVLRDGWLHTGDLGYLDAEGFLYLQGRRSDIIKSGAHRVSPLDIEEVIAALPGVAEVAVVGVPDEVLGEAIKAVVVLKAGAALNGLAVQRHCSFQLPRYKVPKIVEFVERLPRTASGKVMRHKLSLSEPDHDHEARTA